MFPSSAITDFAGNLNVSVSTSASVPTNKAMAATGISHADQLDHGEDLDTAFQNRFSPASGFNFRSSRFSKRWLNPAGTSNMRSSP